MPPPLQDVRASVIITGSSQGLDRVATDLNAVSAAQEQVAATGQTTATVTDIVTKRVLSTASAYERMRAGLDPLVKATQAFERGVALADKALRTGEVTAESHADTVARLKARYDAATQSIAAAEQRVKGFNQAAAERPAFSVQATIDRATGVMGAGGSGDRGADIAAYGAELDRVRAKFDPLFAAQQAHLSQLAEIDRAAKVGAISEATRAAAVAQSTEAYQRQVAAIRAAAAPATLTDPSRQALIDRVTGVTGSATGRDRAADIAAYGQELDGLRAKYSPLFAAQQAYKAQLLEIGHAAKAGAISEAERAAAIARTKEAFSKQVVDLRAKNAGGLAGYQVQNLTAQGIDVGVSLASGQNPLLVAMQQGGQIVPMFAGPGSASVKGAFRQAGEAATAMAARIGVAGGAAIAAGVAVTASLMAWRSYAAAQHEVDVALSGIGRASGATSTELNRIATSAADGGEISRREARSTAATLASTGRISGEMIGALTGTVRDYARMTGQDATEAAKELGSAFASPTQGAAALADKVGGLSDGVLVSVRRLEAQGDRLGAQKALFDAYAANLTKATELTSGWGRTTATVGKVLGDFWDSLGEGVDKALTGGSLDERLANAQARLAELQKRSGTAGFFGSGLLTKTQEEVDGLLDQVATRQRRITQATVAQNSREVGELVRSLTPANTELETLQDKALKLRKAITDKMTLGLDAQTLGALEASFERITRMARNMREDVEQFGSTAAASAVRVSQNANDNVGLNSVDRAIQERRQRLELELREKSLNDLPTADSVRGSYTARLKDPNLDPAEIDAIQAERDARLRTIAERDALTKVMETDVSTIRKNAEETAKRTAVSGDFVSAMINAESGGSLTIKNRMSTATGPGQFIDKTWLGLFRQTFPERASGMNPQEILARRTDRDDSLALIKVHAEENRRSLEKAGFETSNRNQYLAWFAGAEGAIKLLRNPTAMASDILGPKATASNPSVIPGRTSQQVIDWAGRTIARNGAANVQAGRETEVARAQITLIEQTAEAEARRSKGQELLNDHIQRQTELGRAFATIQQLEAADTAKLTEAQRAERDALLERAAAYGKVIGARDNSQLTRNILFEREQLGRTEGEQAIASRLRGTGLGMDSAQAEQLRLNDGLKQTKDLASGVFSGLVSDLRQGTTLMGTLSNLTGRLADKLVSVASDKIISGLFDGLLKGGGGDKDGVLGTIASFFTSSFGGKGYDVGGYTGPGGRFDPAGVVHRGEVVWSQDDVRRHGGVAAVEAMRRGLAGYAVGGYVGGPLVLPGRTPETPAAAGGGTSPVKLVINGAPSTPTVQESSEGNGGRRLEVTFDDAMANAVARPGSRTRAALSQRKVISR